MKPRSPADALLAPTLAALLSGCAPRASTTAEPLRVAAASDLALAFEAIGRAFEQRTGHRVQFVFGASGLLARQLGEGAPFDVFAPADTAYATQTVRAGACLAGTQAPFARGHLAVWSRGDGTRITSLAQLADARVRRVALANHAHAPYGRAAREALEHAGLWAALEPRVVLADNVRHALQLAQSGNADAALVALSLVAHDRAHPWFVVDARAHRPVEQVLVECVHGRARARAAEFTRFVRSAEGRAVLRRYGFDDAPGALVDASP